MRIISILSLILCMTIGNTLFAQDTETKISGKITGNNNKPINGANVVIENSIDGSTSDSTGYFEFTSSKTGVVTLLFTAIDYGEKRVDALLDPGKSVQVNVQLKKSQIVTDEILVTASSFTSGNQTSVTITPLEIVRIPGSDGDLYRALTTFPGTNQVDEGSRITVRGGDPGEVLTVLDQASLYHPFIFDDDFNTSSYTTINPWGLKGINFSSGGFSAKFGNALSGVLDLKSYDMPQGTGAFAWLGLANASLSGVYLNKKKNFGATIQAGQTFLEPYFRINGYLIDKYSPIPLARGFGGTLSYNPNSHSNIKTYFDYADDKIGIRNTSPSYDGFFNSDTKTFFGNVKYSAGIGSKTYLNTGLSFSRHTDNIAYGRLQTNSKEIYSKFRLDITHQLSRKIDINTGGEYEYDESLFGGNIPLFAYDLALDAPYFRLNNTLTKTGRAAGYLETQIRFTKRFFTVQGVRFDYHTLSKKTSVDPRFSAGYRVSKDLTIRGAVGLYHQFADLQYYASSQTSDIKPQQATHYILGGEFNKNNGVFVFRVEGYYKDYKNLVLLNPDGFTYNSNGKGIAKGLDVFIKSGITNKYSAWISYSYTDSKRSQYAVTTLSPATYDITHNISFVGSYNITDRLVTGFTYRVSTGKPYTPVVGSSFDSSYNVYAPIYGETNSSRFPTYQRLDVNLQYIFALFGRFAVAVASVNNVLNQKNLYGYTYNRDYSQQLEIVTSNKRQFYLGLGIQL